MYRLGRLKRTLACVLAAAMMISESTAVFCATETVAESEAELTEETADAGEESVDGEDYKYNLEINQGFSLHVKKDQLTSDSPTYMSNFVAGKATALMVPIEAADDNAAKEVVKNWNLYYKKVTDGNEGDKEQLQWNGSEFSFQDFYDENSNVEQGKKMAYVTLSTGPSKGKYNFYLEDNGTVVAKSDNIDFYDVKPLNILAVPVTAYYSKSANVKPDGGGGCPENLVGQPVSCENNWNGVIDSIKKYLGDVYPISEINIDEGHTIDASSAEFDMCTDDGQRKLWDEACKLQSKDKNTGKDKYDIILAFVMYRQDATGCGQGYTYGKPANIITLTDKDMLPTVAHEIAHCYEVGDEYDGGSYNYRVNNCPIGYTSKGRDKVTGADVSDTTAFTKNVEVYNRDDLESVYYWLSGKQYKDKLAQGVKPAGKETVDEAGSGTVIYPSLHPFILSDKEFVHYAVDGDTVYPTLSYMGSGYSGEKFYYFTTSVIWDHLFNEFMVKEKKEENNNNESGSDGADGDGEDEDLELYYDDECRFGESRMVEVSGTINYASASENAALAASNPCEVEPMFSYDGDLEYIEYFDDDDKEVPDSSRFVFAALDKNGKVIKSPVDGEESMVEFYGGNFNSAMPAPAPNSGMADKRYQDFCEFWFDAEYPEGTSSFMIVKKGDYSADKTYNKNNVLWFKDAPDKIIDGEWTEVKTEKNNISLKWTAAAYDEDDKATTKDLYTMIYYAPQGDDGDVYYINDGDYENDFGAKKDGYATFSFNPTDYTDKTTDKAYVWVKVSDGVNGLDLYSDEYKPGTPDPDPEPSGVSENEVSGNEVSGNEVSGNDVPLTEKEIEKLVAAGNESGIRTQVPNTDTVQMKKEGKFYSISGLDKATGVQTITINAGSKFIIPDLAGLDFSKIKLKINGSEASEKEVKKHLKISGAGVAMAKIDKSAAEYTLTIPLEKYTLVLNVVNVGFDKMLKKQYISSAAGSVSVNLVELAGKTATSKASEFISAEWAIDGKTPVTAGSTATSKKGLEVSVSKNNKTLTVKNTGLTKGAVKITAVINGKKYTTTIKVKA